MTGGFGKESLQVPWNGSASRTCQDLCFQEGSEVGWARACRKEGSQP